MSVVSIVLAALPAIFLLAALIQGRYPGERVIQRLRGQQPRIDRAPATTLRPRPRPRRARRRWGQLISESLAGRAPPAAAAVTA